LYRFLYKCDFFTIFGIEQTLKEFYMEITTYSNFRQNLKRYLDSILASRDPLFVTRSKGDDIVVLAKTDYESMQETIHLLSSPRNAQRIAEALEEYNKGKGERKELID